MSVIDFKAPVDDGAPKLRRARGVVDYSKRHCQHYGQMEIDEDTQLVTCADCKLVMSAYTALTVISRQWERMHYDVTEWKKMRAEQDLEQKRSYVKRKVRELQWVELPEEGDEPARTYWQNLTKAMGHEPYALFRRGRGQRATQYCVLMPPLSLGWSDADTIIRRAEVEAKANVVQAKR